MFFKAIIWLKVLLNVGGCGGQPLSSKSILKVKKQMAAPKEHAHAPFLTQMTVLVGNLSFQSVTNHFERPCRYIDMFEMPKNRFPALP